MIATLRRLGVAILWLLLALLLGFAVAGIASAANRPPVNGSRPELTWTTDRRLDPELAAAASDLTALSGQVDALGTIGRGALVALVDRDVPTLRAAADAGQAKLIEIGLASAALRTRLAALPGFGPDDVTRIGSTLRVRYDRLVTALATTGDLAASWAQLTHATIVATALTTSLADHDALTGRAAGLGGSGEFRAALLVLTRADAALATSATLRDQLANTVDVSILTVWIDRNAAFDKALRRVWTLLDRSVGKVTSSVRTAFRDLRIAQANLPPDTRGLVVIMADLARGGMNQAVINIELARGSLADAVAAVAAPTSSP